MVVWFSKSMKSLVCTVFGFLAFGFKHYFCTLCPKPHVFVYWIFWMLTVMLQICAITVRGIVPLSGQSMECPNIIIRSPCPFNSGGL